MSIPHSAHFSSSVGRVPPSAHCFLCDLQRVFWHRREKRIAERRRREHAGGARSQRRRLVAGDRQSTQVREEPQLKKLAGARLRCQGEKLGNAEQSTRRGLPAGLESVEPGHGIACPQGDEPRHIRGCQLIRRRCHLAADNSEQAELVEGRSKQSSFRELWLLEGAHKLLHATCQALLIAAD
eukprot:scaffold1188_cov255-Pinguiococcus_pyrenoidosus.AAC.12